MPTNICNVPKFSKRNIISYISDDNSFATDPELIHPSKSFLMSLGFMGQDVFALALIVFPCSLFQLPDMLDCSRWQTALRSTVHLHTYTLGLRYRSSTHRHHRHHHTHIIYIHLAIYSHHRHTDTHHTQYYTWPCRSSWFLPWALSRYMGVWENTSYKYENWKCALDYVLVLRHLTFPLIAYNSHPKWWQKNGHQLPSGNFAKIKFAQRFLPTCFFM